MKLNKKLVYDVRVMGKNDYARLTDRATNPDYDPSPSLKTYSPEKP